MDVLLGNGILKWNTTNVGKTSLSEARDLVFDAASRGKTCVI